MQAWHADCVRSVIRSNVSDRSADAAGQYKHCCWRNQALRYFWRQTCMDSAELWWYQPISLPAGHFRPFAEHNIRASLQLDLRSFPVHFSRSSGSGIMPSTKGCTSEGLLA